MKPAPPRAPSRDVLALLSPDGVRALAQARTTRGDPPHRRRRALEGSFPASLARTALAQDDLRERARAKTALAEVLLFTREALEQATPAEVAQERAQRFARFAHVADLCAGVGLDAIALAVAGPRVTAVERDPVRAALLAHNLRAAGVGDRAEVVEGDALERLPPADAAFLDPDRRAPGRPTRDADAFSPPASAWDAIVARYAHGMVKVHPTAPEIVLAGSGVERVSLDGAMREARAGWGDLAVTAPRRALLLPSGAVVEGAGAPWPAARSPEPGEWLLDPDPAVVLAGLVGDAARAAGAAPVHPRIAYLAAPTPVPWARSIRVRAVLAPDARTIRAALASEGAGDVEVLTRGVRDGAPAWRRRIGRLTGDPAVRACVVVTRGPDDRYRVFLGDASGPSGGTTAGIP